MTVDGIQITRAESVALWAQDALALTTEERNRFARALVRPALTRDARALRGAVAYLVTTDPSAVEAEQPALNRLMERAINTWCWRLREPDRERIPITASPPTSAPSPGTQRTR